MLKVVLQYTDAHQDGRQVFKGLAEGGATILKTTSNGMRPKVTIVVKDYQHLNSVVFRVNNMCYNEVRVVRTKMIKEKCKCSKTNN